MINDKFLCKIPNGWTISFWKCANHVFVLALSPLNPPRMVRADDMPDNFNLWPTIKVDEDE